VTLTVAVNYSGDHYLAAAGARTKTVTLASR